jgi:hypothetical protein
VVETSDRAEKKNETNEAAQDDDMKEDLEER